jgi:hypothetical protein
VSTATVTHSEGEIAASREWARLYRRKGYNPLPSRPDDKRPFVRWSEYVEREYPAESFETFATANIQLVTGRRWGLIAVDLDGPEAVEHWSRAYPRCPRTWVTHSGGHGRHLWFAVPSHIAPVPSGRLWGIWEHTARACRGGWRKHVAIELIGDRKLLMVPPSIHPVTGRKYRFLAGSSPKDLAWPAPAPGWLLSLPILKAPRPAPAPRPAREKAPVSPHAGRYDRNQVLDAIFDPVALAEGWGLRVAGGPNVAGWCPCHAIDREDRTPSASIHSVSGSYWEPGERVISLFDLSVRLGIYSDWREAVADLGARHHCREVA